MKDQEPFQWATASAGVKVGIVVLTVLIALVVLMAAAIILGLLVNAIRWAW